MSLCALAVGTAGIDLRVGLGLCHHATWSGSRVASSDRLLQECIDDRVEVLLFLACANGGEHTGPHSRFLRVHVLEALPQAVRTLSRRVIRRASSIVKIRRCRRAAEALHQNLFSWGSGAD